MKFFLCALVAAAAVIYWNKDFFLDVKGNEIEIVKVPPEATLYLAPLKKKEGHHSLFDDYDWQLIETGRKKLQVGGVVYKLVLPNGGERKGLLSINSQTKKVTIN